MLWIHANSEKGGGPRDHGGEMGVFISASNRKRLTPGCEFPTRRGNRKESTQQKEVLAAETRKSNSISI